MAGRADRLKRSLRSANNLAKRTRKAYIRSEDVLSEMEQREARERTRADSSRSDIADRLPAVNPGRRT